MTVRTLHSQALCKSDRRRFRRASVGWRQGSIFVAQKRFERGCVYRLGRHNVFFRGGALLLALIDVDVDSPERIRNVVLEKRSSLDCRISFNGSVDLH